MSRRAADTAIEKQRVKVNGLVARVGQVVEASDKASLDDVVLSAPTKIITMILNKPTGYVCSRDGQGSKTIYELLPPELHNLKPIGRLDKDSSGLLLLTSDGKLAHQLTHPSFQKEKVYELEIDRPLITDDKTKIEAGIELEDGTSTLSLQGDDDKWTVTMTEGRNRQIRRTFEAMGYKVIKLHRVQFGSYRLNELNSSRYKLL